MIRDLLQNIQKNIKSLKINSLKDISNSNKIIVCFSNKILNSDHEIRSFLRHKMYDNKAVLIKNQKGKMYFNKINFQ